MDIYEHDPTQVEMRPIASIIPYGNNAKKHPPEQIEKIAASIKEFGWDQPIVVDGEGVVIKGHGRLLAAKSLGLAEVPVVTRTDLSSEQVVAARMADNQSSISDVDYIKVKTDLEFLQDKGFNLGLTGFSQKEISKALNLELHGEEDQKPEIEFTEELLEEHNYVVLVFDNSVDWLQAQSILGLKTVKSLDSKPGFEKAGIGRVLRGPQAFNKLKEEFAK